MCVTHVHVHGSSCCWQKQIGGDWILTAFDAAVAAAVRARLGRWLESMFDRGDVDVRLLPGR